MKKALIYTSVASMIDQFNRDNIKILQSLGYKVEVACNFEKGNTIDLDQIEHLKKYLDNENVVWHHIPIPRKISSLKEIMTSYRISKALMDAENYALMHFHSPIGAAIGRYAARKSREKGSEIIYTAHGFHFHKGAPLFNWLSFYPIERYLSHVTDTLITINTEDYKRAQKFKTSKITFVPGIGIDTEKIAQIDINRVHKRQDLDVRPDACFLLSVGELNPNKNHQLIINALAKLQEPFHYFICGQGDERSNLEILVKEQGLEDKVTFLGYRNDVLELLNVADIYCFPSKREGLSVALMEAMAAGLPCVASNIRGNNDLIDAHGGFLFELNNDEALLTSLKTLLNSETKRKSMGEYNLEKIKGFDKRIINKQMKEIYS